MNVLAVVAILIYSFLFSFKAGERGFFPLDQSIEFDGAYRIISGQVPYKDFLIPVGPVVFWLQALVFKLFGVTFTSFLIGAAAINFFATALSMLTLWKLFPGNRWPALVAGFLTATWFYPPYGTPNMEQTAFFFSLLGIACSSVGVWDGTRKSAARGLMLIVAGFCAVLSFLSKQNAGVFIIPLYMLMLMVAYLPDARELLVATAWLVGGVLILVSGFVTWLLLESNPTLFQEHFFSIPGRLGVARLLAGQWWEFFSHLLGGRSPDYVHATLFASMALGVFILGMVFSRSRGIACLRRPALAALLCIYLPVFQSAVIASTSNQWQECMPFVGITVGCALGLATLVLDSSIEYGTLSLAGRPFFSWDMATLVLVASIITSNVVGARAPETLACVLILVGAIVGVFRAPFALLAESRADLDIRSSRTIARRWLFVIAATVGVAGCGWQGIAASWDRSVHDIFSGSTFTHYTRIQGLEHLKWGKPTIVQGSEFTEEDLTCLVARLRRDGTPFFVFPEFTVLYALLDVPSPQPLLWFHKGLTYPSDYSEALDRWIVDSLVRQNVELVVLQQSWWFKPRLCDLADFPMLDAYIREHFVFEEQLGSFRILRRNRRPQNAARGGHQEPHVTPLF